MSMLDEMRRIQEERDLTDQAFADMLGITRESWNYIKNNREPLTARIRENTVRVFPELIPIFLSEIITNSKVGK